MCINMKNTFKNIIELKISNQTISNGYSNLFGEKELRDFVVYTFSKSINKAPFINEKLITTYQFESFQYSNPTVV